MDLIHERLYLVLMLAKPVEIDPVRPDLSAGVRHQRAGLRLGRDLIQRVPNCGHPIGCEAVLAIAEVEDPDVAVAVKCGCHRASSVTLVGSWTRPDTRSRSTKT